MRFLAAIFFLLVSVAASAQFRSDALAGLYDSETAASMKESVGFLASASLEGRAAGSEGEKEAAEYVSAAFEEAGLDLLYPKSGDIFGVRQESGDTLCSRNVAAFIPGYDKALKEKYIVIYARLDNLGTRTVSVDGTDVTSVLNGANGNASGLALLMELAKRLRTNSVLLKRSVILAAFGASLPDCAGAWYFLNRSFKGTPDIDAAIELETLGIPSGGFYAYTASNADLNAGIVSLSSTLQPVKPEIVAAEPCPGNHRMFYDAKIPVTMFTTGMYPEYNTPRDTPSILEYDGMERVLEYLYNYTVALACAEAPEFNPSEKASESYMAGRTEAVPYYECDTRPSFFGSTDPAIFLTRWVYVYMKYPRAAVEQGIQGRVLVDFIIDAKGRVTQVKALRSSHPLLEEEALRVVKASPDWKPGRIKGKKVPARITLNVEFRLEKKK